MVGVRRLRALGAAALMIAGLLSATPQPAQAMAKTWVCFVVDSTDSCSASGSEFVVTVTWHIVLPSTAQVPDCDAAHEVPTCMSHADIAVGKDATGSCPAGQAVNPGQPSFSWHLDYPVPRSFTCTFTYDSTAYPFPDRVGSLLQAGPADVQRGVGARYLEPSSPAPTVRLAANSTADPLVYDLVATATPGTGLAYAWRYGDGESTPGGGAVQRHRFKKPGKYTVSVTVGDSSGRTATASVVVEIDRAIVVNSDGDRPDKKPSDDVCSTGHQVAGKPECTLRAAIQTADARTGTQEVTFKIPGKLPRIDIAKSLPAMTVPVELRGSTQKGGWVEIRGPGHKADGLVALAGRTTIKGFVLGGLRSAVVLRGGSGSSVSKVRVGLPAKGDSEVDHRRRTDTGVLVDGSSGNRISSVVVTGADEGVAMVGPASSGNTLAGSTVGVTNGKDAAGGNGVGVHLGGGAHDNVVTGNVVGGNGRFDIAVEHGTANRVLGNHVGVAKNDHGIARGASRAQTGILVDESPATVVAGNTIADHRQVDLLVFSSPGVAITGNGIGVTTGGKDATAKQHDADAGLILTGAGAASVSGNLIAAHEAVDLAILGTAKEGVQIKVSHQAVTIAEPPGTPTGLNASLTGNLIGVLPDSRPPRHGAVAGVIVTAHADGTTLGAGNVVAGHVTEVELIHSDLVRIQSSRVGVAKDGSAKGSKRGVVVRATTRASVVGTTVSGNSDTGIAVVGGSGTILDGDRIGVSPTSPAARPNGTGVDIDAASAGTVVRNSTIAYNNGTGVRVAGAATLRGNRIHHNKAGGIAAPGSGPTVAMVDRRGTGEAARTQVLVTGVAAGSTVEVFGQASCTGAQGEVPVLLGTVKAGRTWFAATAQGQPTLTAFTATATSPAGATSRLSSCAVAGTAPDGDGDGVPTAIESLASNGDGDNDGTPDAGQASVVSPLDVDGDPVTFVTPSGAAFAQASLVEPIPSPPPATTFPAGVFGFRLSGLPSGATYAVHAVLPADVRGTTYLTRESAWSALTGRTAVPDGWTLPFVDGGAGDGDGTANGTVVALGGPAGTS